MSLSLLLSLPDELWAHVFEWLDTPTYVRLEHVCSSVRALRKAMPWARLVANDARLWTRYTRGFAPAHCDYPTAVALFSTLGYQRKHSTHFGSTVSHVTTSTTTVYEFGDATYSLTTRGVCVWEGPTFTWYDLAAVPLPSALCSTSVSVPCAFAVLPWNLPDTVDAQTVWAAEPQHTRAVRVDSVSGEPEDFVALTNYRQYFRVTRGATYHTTEFLMGGAFESAIASPKVEHFCFPYVVVSGYLLVPPVTVHSLSQRVMGVWNIQTRQPGLARDPQYGWFRPCSCSTADETGRTLYWVDADARTLHRCHLDAPYARDPGYPKLLPGGHVTGVAVSEVKGVVALYTTEWIVYDARTWGVLRTYNLRHSRLWLHPHANAVHLARVVGSKLWMQRARLAHDTFFLSPPDPNATVQ